MEIMKDNNKDKLMALYSKKSTPNSDNDFTDESEGDPLIVRCYVSRSDKKPSGYRRFQSKPDSSAPKSYDVARKYEKEGRKCIKYGGIDHFATEYKIKKVETSGEYEVKYKKLIVDRNRQNIDMKILIVEVESWVDDEDNEKEKCLIESIDVFVTDEGTNQSSTFEFDLAKAARDSKMLGWDLSSIYQVKKLSTILIMKNSYSLITFVFNCQTLTNKNTLL